MPNAVSGLTLRCRIEPFVDQGGGAACRRTRTRTRRACGLTADPAATRRAGYALLPRPDLLFSRAMCARNHSAAISTASSPVTQSTLRPPGAPCRC